MEYDLSTLSEKPEGEYPLDTIEERIGSVVAYTVALTYVLRELQREYKGGILGAYKLGFVDESVFGAIRSKANTLTVITKPKIKKIFEEESLSHLQKWINSIKKALGIDVKVLLSKKDTEKLLKIYINKNVGLVKSMSDDMVKRIEQEVWDAYKNKRSATDLSKRLQKHFKTMKRTRADLIASDQLSKFNADLNVLRQQQAGQKEYKWDYQHGIPRKTSREYHKVRHNRVYKFGKPSGDEPSWAIGCKCRHQAIIKVIK